MDLKCSFNDLGGEGEIQRWVCGFMRERGGSVFIINKTLN